MADGESVFITASDGLRLHARIYGRGHAGRAVVCLPGLTRTAEDFAPLAHALSAQYRIIALDYRGRGLSSYDADPAKYNVMVELGDVLTVMTALDALPALVIGTSRGGILAMLMAASRPDALTGAILNDIGPVIEVAGLLRIKGYVGKLPQPASLEEAATNLRSLFGSQFPRLTEEDWLASARRAFKNDEGRLVPTYDTALARTLDGVSADQPIPALWDAFDALARKPLLVIRGALSDLLSAGTVSQMRARSPSIEFLEVADQGHAPLLDDAETIGKISDFINRSP